VRSAQFLAQVLAQSRVNICEALLFPDARGSERKAVPWLVLLVTPCKEYDVNSSAAASCSKAHKNL